MTVDKSRQNPDPISAASLGFSSPGITDIQSFCQIRNRTGRADKKKIPSIVKRTSLGAANSLKSEMTAGGSSKKPSIPIGRPIRPTTAAPQKINAFMNVVSCFTSSRGARLEFCCCRWIGLRPCSQVWCIIEIFLKLSVTWCTCFSSKRFHFQRLTNHLNTIQE